MWDEELKGYDNKETKLDSNKMIIDTIFGANETQERSFSYTLEDNHNYLLCFSRSGTGVFNLIADFPEVNAFDSVHREELSTTKSSLTELYDQSSNIFTKMQMRTEKHMSYDKSN